jgi:hypothetical protein
MTIERAGLCAAVILLQATLAVAAPPEVPKAADVSIHGVFLFDLESQRRVLGDVRFSEKTAMPQARFASEDGAQRLTLVSHPGSVGDVAEVAVSHGKGDGKRLAGAKAFVTGKGIRLGITEQEVTALLGAPLRARRTGSSRTLEYRVEERPGKASAFLEHYGMPVYYGIYSFSGDRLVAFRFGFEYP